MKSKYEIQEHNPKFKEYLFALLDNSKYLNVLETKGRPYGIVFSWIVENAERLSDSHEPLPSAKELSATLGIEGTKLKNHLKMIYEDIHSLNDSNPELFGSIGHTLCTLHFRSYDKAAVFTLGLISIPRMHESFTFHFIHPKMNTASFYVHSVSHEITSRGHQVNIRLIAGLPNAYFTLLKEKAYLERIITFEEYYHAEQDFMIEEKLLKQVRSL